jgi:hypothetical protein
MTIVGVDHVQLAMPAGREAKARRFYARGYDRVYVDDPFGNRIELLEPSLARASGREH